MAFITPALPTCHSSNGVPKTNGPQMRFTLPRRGFLAVSLPLLLATPSLASETLSEASADAAAARSATSSLADLLDLEEWEDFRRALRAGPMGRVRVACSRLVRETNDSLRGEAEGAYKRLIKKVEEADFAALQRERGGKQDVAGMLKGVEDEFDKFLKVIGTT